jgi:glycosyltransferase involved in cell wall biosynthesis
MMKPGVAVWELGMHFDASLGGVDRYFQRLTEGLRSNGVPCTALAFGASASTVPLAQWDGRAQASVSLGESHAPLMQRWGAIRTAGRRIPAQDVIATHFALYAAALPQLRTRRHVVHFHGPWAGESAREGQSRLVVMAKRWIENRVYGSADRFIVLSSAFRHVLSTDYQIPAEKIRIVPGGVETARFVPRNKQEARRRLGWPEQAPIILCVRRLVHRMGLATLIAAFASLRCDHPGARLIIAGRGPLETELRQKAASEGCEDSVVFTGFVPDEDLPLAYAAADFSIVPSESLEGFGLTTLESLACGTPVLVTPVGGLPETVCELDPALILTGKDAASLAEGIRRGLAGELPSSTACRAHVETRFDWSAIARRVAAVYEEVLA